MFYGFTENLKFTAQHKKTLSEAQIGENAFGAILPVFEAALKLVDKGEISLTENQQASLETARKLNALLPKPIELGLKRPVAKSYPHVLGLFLLLRATGLTIVDSKTKTPKLRLDPEFYAKWQSLNPSERYFILLETWLLRASAEIIGEWESPYSIPNAFESWLRFNRKLLEGAVLISGKKTLYDELRYFPKLHNLGLLDLFAFITIEHRAPVQGEAWQIERIENTPLGAAVIALLYTEFFTNTDFLYELYEDESLSYGALQSVFQPYFPAWQANISPALWEFRQGQHIFKLSLGQIWRRLAIDAFETLDTLADLILSAVDFDNDHLYDFHYKRRSGKTQTIHHPATDDLPDTSEIRVGNLPLNIGQSMTFRFDFGDNWEFDLVLEAANPQIKQKTPEILETHGEAPIQYPYGDDEIYFEIDENGEMLLYFDDFDDDEDETEA